MKMTLKPMASRFLARSLTCALIAFAACSQEAIAQETRAALPHDLSPLGMFMAADIVVKAIMSGLMLASVATWTVWIAKVIEVGIARRRASKGLATLRSSTSLANAADRLAGAGGAVAAIAEEAVAEARKSTGTQRAAGILERVSSRLADVEAAAIRSARTGTGILASIGATAPFIGLLGTVWGIMNSFIGISKAQTTNLAVVAPGIAEALLATAIGLVAAIPAVLFYNHLGRSIAAYRALVREAASETQRHLSRDLDREAGVSRGGAPVRLAAE